MAASCGTTTTGDTGRFFAVVLFMGFYLSSVYQCLFQIRVSEDAGAFLCTREVSSVPQGCPLTFSHPLTLRSIFLSFPFLSTYPTLPFPTLLTIPYPPYPSLTHSLTQILPFLPYCTLPYPPHPSPCSTLPSSTLPQSCILSEEQ